MIVVFCLNRNVIYLFDNKFERSQFDNLIKKKFFLFENVLLRTT